MVQDTQLVFNPQLPQDRATGMTLRGISYDSARLTVSWDVDTVRVSRLPSSAAEAAVVVEVGDQVYVLTPSASSASFARQLFAVQVQNLP